MVDEYTVTQIFKIAQNWHFDELLLDKINVRVPKIKYFK